MESINESESYVEVWNESFVCDRNFGIFWGTIEVFYWRFRWKHLECGNSCEFVSSPLWRHIFTIYHRSRDQSRGFSTNSYLFCLSSLFCGCCFLLLLFNSSLMALTQIITQGFKILIIKSFFLFRKRIQTTNRSLIQN